MVSVHFNLFPAAILARADLRVKSNRAFGFRPLWQSIQRSIKIGATVRSKEASWADTGGDHDQAVSMKTEINGALTLMAWGSNLRD